MPLIKTEFQSNVILAITLWHFQTPAEIGGKSFYLQFPGIISCENKLVNQDKLEVVT